MAEPAHERVTMTLSGLGTKASLLTVTNSKVTCSLPRNYAEKDGVKAVELSGLEKGVYLVKLKSAPGLKRNGLIVSSCLVKFIPAGMPDDFSCKLYPCFCRNQNGSEGKFKIGRPGGAGI